MPRYEVRFEIDVDASSPEIAVRAARDMLLDPEQRILADVHEYEYCEAADDWFPNHDKGWHADFSEGGVQPQYFFPWITSNAGQD